MKIRQGFVSNSSSSSYFVVFTPAAMRHDIINHVANSSTIFPISRRIEQIEKDLEWNLKWCKEKGRNPDENEEVVESKQLIARLKSVENRALYIEMERGEGEYAVTDLLDLLKSIGLVENYENEY